MLAKTIDIALYALALATFWLCLWKLVATYRPQAAPGLPELPEWLEDKERGMSWLASIAAGAPFVGLAGTIGHIIEALSHLSGAGADLSVISGPIAQSLYSTLWGLASALPATLVYNQVAARLQVVENRVRRDSEAV